MCLGRFLINCLQLDIKLNLSHDIAGHNIILKDCNPTKTVHDCSSSVEVTIAFFREVSAVSLVQCIHW